VISADGRYVAFSSTSTNLVTGPDANGAGEDIYLQEIVSRSIRRVSVDNNGTQSSTGASFIASISEDGRYVAFSSSAPLDSRAKPPRTFVYVRDTAQNTTTMVAP
jgi:hypothetical protein